MIFLGRVLISLRFSKLPRFSFWAWFLASPGDWNAFGSDVASPSPMLSWQPSWGPAVLFVATLGRLKATHLHMGEHEGEGRYVRGVHEGTYTSEEKHERSNCFAGPWHYGRKHVELQIPVNVEPGFPRSRKLHYGPSSLCEVSFLELIHSDQL